ncbi:glycosyltransferase, group 1 family protein [Bifidobacterium pseudolongum subsp. globosum]|uniref:Glycosyltransferase, group 1 family protein n=2 Tax=Bifidobacterium pseudolongum TaxID=1694 RepID=A0A2N3R5J6_9BIFI|nr:glycosyltransferase, group 1 family protein [Bifidobacterium pseudolongum subsp. globosum]
MLIKENEADPSFDFTVFSTYDTKAQQSVKDTDYHHTHFTFISTPSLITFFDKFIYHVFKNILRKKKAMSYRYILQRLWYIRQVGKKLASQDVSFDNIMIENHSSLFNVLKVKDNSSRYRGKVLYHLHNIVQNDYGCLNQIAAIGKLLGVSHYINETFNDFLMNQGQKAIPPEKQHVWKNCVDVEVFNRPLSNTDEKELRDRYQIPNNSTIFLFSGRLTPEKGAQELLEAFTKVAATTPNVHLIIAGSLFFNTGMHSDFEDLLYEYANNSSVRERITFTGFIPYDEMHKIYAISDICVLPSIWDDPAPLAVIEAMAAGKPIITTYSGGIPEYVKGACAILIERNTALVDSLANAMTKLSQSPNLRSTMAKASARIGKGLNPRHYLSQLNEIVNNKR